MKRILINATHNEEVRVALCKGSHLYDFDLENRTREQKKSNIYKGHVTRVEPSLEAVFVEYGSKRQGFLPIREIASDYLTGNPREESIRKLIKEGDELIVQVEKEERGNKGAALSTYISLAGRYLVLMPNNPKGGGISRQISGKLREDMKRMLGDLGLPKGMSVIVRTAGIGKTQEDLQHDLNHLLNIWNAIQNQNKKYASPRLVHQEAGVVTRAVRDYLRDDIAEIWIDNEEAFMEAETFVKAVMPKQVEKLRKYTDFEPMFTSFKVERQIETAYQREVRLPSGGSIVIDQTEALVSIDINSAKSTKGADVQETAYHTNLEAADEIARQLRLRDMGGLVVIDFIDMNDNKHQKDVEKRLVEATKYDRARVQFGEISRFGLMEMSRQRLRPSLEESTGYICPRCHGNGMIRDLRSLSLSIMRQIEQTALKERHGEIQAEVPTDIAAFLLNEKRESLVYLEQDSGTRITILPHAHLESPHFNLHFNHQGFAPSSYERITDTQEQETSDRGYEVNWQTADSERPEQQPTRQPRTSMGKAAKNTSSTKHAPQQTQTTIQAPAQAAVEQAKPDAVAWLSNLFAPTPEAQKATSISSTDAAQAIEAIVNTGAQSRGAFGDISRPAAAPTQEAKPEPNATSEESENNKERRRSRNNKNRNRYDKKNERNKIDNRRKKYDKADSPAESTTTSSRQQEKTEQAAPRELPKREPNSKRDSRGVIERGEAKQVQKQVSRQDNTKGKQSTPRSDSKSQPRVEKQKKAHSEKPSHRENTERHIDPNEVTLNVTEAKTDQKQTEVVHISLDKPTPEKIKPTEQKINKPQTDTKPATPVAKTEPKKVDITVSSTIKPETLTATPQATPAPVTPAAADLEVEDTDTVTMTFDPSVLFADRYVAAQRFGTANNDPRHVKAAMAKAANVESDETEAVAPVNAPAIKGSVGQFINTHLAQASQRLAKDGVITCFLSALNAYSETSGLKSAAVNKKNAKLEVDKANATQEFSFVNYGYETLSPSYLQNFTQMTSAVAAHNTEQGKTEVEPAPVMARASNDPRGQHPDFAEIIQSDAAPNVETKETPEHAESVKDVSTDTTVVSANVEEGNTEASQAQTNNNSDASVKLIQETKPEKSPAEAMGDLLKLNTGHFINRVLGQEGLDIISEGNTEAAFLQALRQPLDVLVSVAQAVDDVIHPHSSTDNVDKQTTDTKSDSPNLAPKEPTPKESAESTGTVKANGDDNATEAQTGTDTAGEVAHDEESKASSNSSSNKTSIESYKSMIENISEQLLPQTGILNLTTPTPKTRSRKVKEETDSSDDSDKS